MGPLAYLVAIGQLVQVRHSQEIRQNFLPFHWLNVAEAFGLLKTHEWSLNGHSP